MKLLIYSAITAAIFGATILSADPVLKTSKPRICVYDSRAVAVAFAGSEAHRKSLAPLFAEHKKAIAAGDTKRVMELEAEGKARQKRAHQQAFSTAPVDDLLEHIKDRLPGIKQEAGLERGTELVSKWDKQGLARHQSAEQVDLTLALVNAFDPSEKQRQSAMEIQQQKPVSRWRVK